jgi:hypothetical protein
MPQAHVLNTGQGMGNGTEKSFQISENNLHDRLIIFKMQCAKPYCFKLSI